MLMFRASEKLRVERCCKHALSLNGLSKHIFFPPLLLRAKWSFLLPLLIAYVRVAFHKLRRHSRCVCSWNAFKTMRWNVLQWAEHSRTKASVQEEKSTRFQHCWHCWWICALQWIRFRIRCARGFVFDPPINTWFVVSIRGGTCHVCFNLFVITILLVNIGWTHCFGGNTGHVTALFANLLDETYH